MNEIIFRKAFEEIENTSEFKSINTDISEVFYSLYIRCKRLYLTTALIKKTSDKDITHIESLPLFRAFLESFFHISYVMSEKDTSKIREGYQYLRDHSHSLIASKMKDSKEKGSLANEFINLHSKDVVIPSKYKFLDSPKQLADKTGKIDIWRKHYNVLNSFLHYNPSTFINYGMFDEEGTFIFNQENDSEKDNVFELIDKFIFVLICEIIEYFQNEELDKKLMNLLSEYAERTLKKHTN